MVSIAGRKILNNVKNKYHVWHGTIGLPIFAATYTERNECGKCEIANEKGHVGILHPSLVEERACLHFGHHPEIAGGASDCRGGHAVSIADALEELRVPQL